MTSKLDQLRHMTTVVADTGDLDAIRQWQPRDATTNPSLLLKAVASNAYRHLIEQALAWAQERAKTDSPDPVAVGDCLAVLAGAQILQSVPGMVSTEVDARLSFDRDATIARARHLTDLYRQKGVDTDRVMIKIAATWEGIQAARVLEREGIACNLTLLFSFTQAMACADAGVTLISPFVGRILDWYLAQTGQASIDPANDPGVQSVQRIYNYYKSHGYPTIVMGASFRNQGEIEHLAGCDRLTISPQLLEALSQDTDTLEQQLTPDNSNRAETHPCMDEREFRWHLNEDAMASDKLADGIRRFAADQRQLEANLEKWIQGDSTP
ncbi:transaldolase [Salicola sp. Rm-C-2C1-2]|uniref:transaldolase n=1 Tax=Salicola sp. Rm-C-2C1-2 TaxID=3141321 RepID=UPI0032E3D652